MSFSFFSKEIISVLPYLTHPIGVVVMKWEGGGKEKHPRQLKFVRKIKATRLRSKDEKKLTGKGERGGVKFI